MTTGPQFARLSKLADERHVPLSVTFEILQSCNLRCVHCYNFDRELPQHPDPERGAALADAEIHRVIDEVRAEGALFLAFTGGEPTAHPSLESFVSHGATAGAFTRLKTNGTRLTPSRVAGLVRAGLRAVDVSLYGASAEVHDAFVRRRGAFSLTLAGLRNARAAGLLVQISFVMSRTNASEADAMASLADGLGVRHSFNPHLTARYDGSRSSRDFQVDRQMLDRLYRGAFAQYLPAGKRPVRIACPCARSVCGIGASGDVYPCIGAPLPAGNLRRQRFREIWRESPTFRWIRSLRNQDFPTCNSCRLLPYCRRSSGQVLTNTGDFTGPARFGDDSFCVEAEVVRDVMEAAAPTPMRVG